MEIKIALAGNPNCGKTTLFNALTGSNQYVGNWPGVTVEKKEGNYKKDKSVKIVDLPGIYSLSPYTLEEVVARNFLIDERPDAILNIVDGTNIERNLYLTTQLTELGIPVVVAINMIDVVNKNGDIINIQQLSKSLGCRVVEISALKNKGIEDAVDEAINAANGKRNIPRHNFSGTVEHALAHIEEVAVHHLPEEQQRWYAIKIFENDEKVLKKLNLPKSTYDHIQKDIQACENELDDDAESIITNERYIYIGSILKGSYKKKNSGKLTTSDKIDKVVTNKYASLPIFALIMFIVYYISVTTVGSVATNWANEGVFGKGWHLATIGASAYDEATVKFSEDNLFTADLEEVVKNANSANIAGADEILASVENKDYNAFLEAYGTYNEVLTEAGEQYDLSRIVEPVLEMENWPAPEDYGIWIPGIPVLVEKGLDAVNCNEVVKSLVLEGIIGGVGAVLGFVPQILVLFLLLGFLEGCGYMARIAFIMDRFFRKFGLSGKSFIAIIIGTGCGVPGIMASRTIENDRDRKMTIITTTFIPCSAKLPVIALITTALFDGAWWVAPSAYFMGVAAIALSGIILRKTKLFAGETAPFVMELPAYHMPALSNILRSMWERGYSFVKKAGTVILLSSILIWFLNAFSFSGGFHYIVDSSKDVSIIEVVGSAICWIFTPLGFGNSSATVATLMGLIAKEEIVGVFGVLDFAGIGKLAGYSFLIFNLLCAPCFAAMGAIRREMNNWKWTAFAISYQCVFAYAISLIIYQFGLLLSGNVNVIGLIVATLVFAVLTYLVFRKDKTIKKNY